MKVLLLILGSLVLTACSQIHTTDQQVKSLGINACDTVSKLNLEATKPQYTLLQKKAVYELSSSVSHICGSGVGIKDLATVQFIEDKAKAIKLVLGIK